MKVLLWVLIAFAVGMWLTYGKKKKVEASRKERMAPSGDDPEEIVRCAHCGTYVPASESVAGQTGLTFCCEEHRLRHSSPDRSA